MSGQTPSVCQTILHRKVRVQQVLTLFLFPRVRDALPETVFRQDHPNRTAMRSILKRHRLCYQRKPRNPLHDHIGHLMAGVKVAPLGHIDEAVHEWLLYP